MELKKPITPILSKVNFGTRKDNVDCNKVVLMAENYDIRLEFTDGFKQENGSYSWSTPVVIPLKENELDLFSHMIDRHVAKLRREQYEAKQKLGEIPIILSEPYFRTASDHVIRLVGTVCNIPKQNGGTWKGRKNSIIIYKIPDLTTFRAMEAATKEKKDWSDFEQFKLFEYELPTINNIRGAGSNSEQDFLDLERISKTLNDIASSLNFSWNEHKKRHYEYLKESNKTGSTGSEGGSKPSYNGYGNQTGTPTTPTFKDTTDDSVFDDVF